MLIMTAYIQDSKNTYSLFLKRATKVIMIIIVILRATILVMIIIVILLIIKISSAIVSEAL